MFYFCAESSYECFTKKAMATFKVVILPHHKKEDGTYNVKIRVTHNRKTRYIKTPYYIGGADVSRRKRNGKEEIKIKNQAVIDALDAVILDYRRRLVPHGLAVDTWDIDRFIEFLSVNPSSFSLDFIAYTKKMANRLISEGRESTGKQYMVMANAVVRFIGRDSMDISEITGNFLRAFESHLKTEPVHKNTNKKAEPIDKKKNGTSIHNYISKIRTVHEQAKLEYNDEDNGIINIPWSPFNKYKIPPMPVSEHRVLTIEQVQKIIDYPYSGKDTAVDLGKDMFILSFAMMGINTADLYEVEDIQGDILTYERRKTRTMRNDRAKMEVRIEPEIRGLVAKYLSKSRLVDVRKRYKTLMSFNAAVNRGLDTIGKVVGVDNLTFYYARHSMASICANILGVEIARVDEMLNHSDPRMALARVYIAKDFKPLWDANRRLLDLFKWDGIQENAQK